MIINPFIFGSVAPSTYLVDLYSPEGSFSFRKTSSTSTNAIRIRRSSDSAEQDIGFVGDDLDTASMAAFVGVNSAYLTTWYDQSGNGFNLTQTTATKQPRIVNAGTNETHNGFVCAKYDGINDWLTGGTSFMNLNGLDSMFSTAVVSSTLANNVVYARSRYASADGRFTMNSSGGVNSVLIQNTLNIKNPIGGIGTGLYNQQWDGANLRIYKNDSLEISNVIPGTCGNLVSRFLVGAYNNAGDTGEQAGFFQSGKIQELNIWKVDKSADRTDINTDINTYYTIY